MSFITELFKRKKRTYEVEMYVMGDNQVMSKFNVTVTARTSFGAKRQVTNMLTLKANRAWVYKKK